MLDALIQMVTQFVQNNPGAVGHALHQFSRSATGRDMRQRLEHTLDRATDYVVGKSRTSQRRYHAPGSIEGFGEVSEDSECSDVEPMTPKEKAQAFQGAFSRFKSSRVYAQGNIPDNVARSLCETMCIKDRFIFLLIDASAENDGSEGFAVTEKAIYCRNEGEKRVRIALGKLGDYEISHSGKIMDIGGYKLAFNPFSVAQVKRFCEIVRIIAIA